MASAEYRRERAGSLLLLVLCALAAGCEQDLPASDNESVTGRGSNKDVWWSELPRPAWQRYPRVDQSQDWFEVYEVSSGVFAIYEPGQFEEVISYLITGEQRALLFDTGLGIGDMRRLVDELVTTEVLVLNSHTHYDHIGGNFAFETILGRDTPYTAAHTAGLPHEEVAFAVGPGWIWKPTPEGFSPESYHIRPFSITRWVEDHEIIDLGGRRLEVLFVPGHAPDAVALLDRDQRLLFTGDTFYLAPLYAHLEGSDLAQYADTAERLSELGRDVDRLMPSHNEPGVSAEYLGKLDLAMRRIESGMAPTIATDGNWEFEFGEFSVITPPRRD